MLIFLWLVVTVSSHGVFDRLFDFEVPSVINPNFGNVRSSENYYYDEDFHEEPLDDEDRFLVELLEWPMNSFRSSDFRIPLEKLDIPMKRFKKITSNRTTWEKFNENADWTVFEGSFIAIYRAFSYRRVLIDEDYMDPKFLVDDHYVIHWFNDYQVFVKCPELAHKANTVEWDSIESPGLKYNQYSYICSDDPCEEANYFSRPFFLQGLYSDANHRLPLRVHKKRKGPGRTAIVENWRTFFTCQTKEESLEDESENAFELPTLLNNFGLGSIEEMYAENKNATTAIRLFGVSIFELYRRIMGRMKFTPSRIVNLKAKETTLLRDLYYLEDCDFLNAKKGFSETDMMKQTLRILINGLGKPPNQEKCTDEQKSRISRFLSAAKKNAEIFTIN